MRRPDVSGLVGVVFIILLIVAATAAIIVYKRYDVQQVLIWSVIGLAIIFLVGILFTGIKLPGPRPVKLVIYMFIAFIEVPCLDKVMII